MELPAERLQARFGPDSTLTRTPALVGPTTTQKRGIVGQGVNLTVQHLEDTRDNTIAFHLAKHLLHRNFRDPDADPKLHLFGQLKGLAQDWVQDHLICRGGTWKARVRAYAKNHGLGFEVPYRMGGVQRQYRPDFIVRIDDGRPDLLNLVVEIKGFRGEDAAAKAETMRTQWVPGVNALGAYGRWAFEEFRSAHDIEAEFDALVLDAAATSPEIP